MKGAAKILGSNGREFKSLENRALGDTAFFLILISAATQLLRYWAHYALDHRFVRLFNVEAENNIPTLFSTVLLLFAACLLAVISLLKRRQSDPHRWCWAILSSGFLYLTIDEASSLHELLNRVAAVFYTAGAIGAEMIGGYYAGLHGSRNLDYRMIATVEEGLEMAGVIVFIYALLKYIGSHLGDIEVRFNSDPEGQRS
ncbi:MAG: hypothetical protein WAU81_01735 [Candidatus Aminicenantales bacterium]